MSALKLIPSRNAIRRRPRLDIKLIKHVVVYSSDPLSSSFIYQVTGRIQERLSFNSISYHFVVAFGIVLLPCSTHLP